MKNILALVLVALLMGCGKKEESSNPPGMICLTVTVIKVTETQTLLEVVGSGPQVRMLREGVFGDVDDVFKFCEKG